MAILRYVKHVTTLGDGLWFGTFLVGWVELVGAFGSLLVQAVSVAIIRVVTSS